jgi:hypothetical protein
MKHFVFWYHHNLMIVNELSLMDRCRTEGHEPIDGLDALLWLDTIGALSRNSLLSLLSERIPDNIILSEE